MAHCCQHCISVERDACIWNVGGQISVQIWISKSQVFKLQISNLAKQIPVLNPAKANQIKSRKLKSQIKFQILFYSARKICQTKKADKINNTRVVRFTASKYYTDYSLQVMVISTSRRCSSDSTVAADRLLRLTRTMAPAILNSHSTDEDVAGILR